MNKEESVKFGARYYHQDCLEVKQKKEGSKQALEEKEKAELKDLKDYLWFELYNQKVQMSFLMKQVKNMREEHGFRYKGMELALRYHYQIKGEKLQEGHGIGIIPYIYEEAKQYYALLLENKKHAETFTEPSTKKVTVAISNRKKEELPVIDIESL